MADITTVLFDLDGTLLPMDQETFVHAYLGLLAQKMAPLGYDPKQLVKAIWSGVGAMAANDGSRTNEDAFWDDFAARLGAARLNDKPVFEDFYAHEFQQAQPSCGYDERAAETVALAQNLGFRVALATNPIFPAVATLSRVRWAGMDPDTFELVTTYEDSRTCKPNPAYFSEVAERLGVAPEHCLMVGNDLTEDTAAAQVGMGVFILTDSLIAPEGTDLEAWEHGGFPELQAYLRGIAAR
ncbi:HAD family hydrolase [Olsenella sp. YH-ols2217]|uniref:HAD family hydrolase n=1 Tax=Kribbibacterium absianum TaxID=3044210 RepID=A0ABT6ZHZ7_9ACTN|nr:MULTISPECIES: HAD family hydrolase [unclassified Olsenella]MDJ1121187.1 HAD family hydrolase [Olsenella sp. YH-ols2216]MDJ1128678.1 HAD family hydrolase [Olsenella sp. YH-ols2217]